MGRPPAIITTRKILTMQEQKHLIQNCLKPTPHDPLNRNGLMLLLIYECGLRGCEMRDFKVKDIYQESCSIYIQSKKNSNPRELPIKPKRMKQLQKFVLAKFNAYSWNELDPEALIFPMTGNHMRRIWNFYRVNPQKTLHSLRHSFSYRMYVKSRDVKFVQICLGHRDIKNTQVYLDFFYTQGSMRKFMCG
jgi:integrase/recombinase XerC